MNLILICESISGFVKRINMMKESMIETEVTCSFEQDGKFFLIERCRRGFAAKQANNISPQKTVEHIQGIIKNRTVLKKTDETPVYEFV